MDGAVEERKTAAANPPSRRLALVAIASNTGVMSDGELAITFRMSAVAVCRSSASLVSLNSRDILDRDHGLVGEGLQQLERDGRANAAGLLPRDADRAERNAARASAARTVNCESRAPPGIPDQHSRVGSVSAIDGTRPRRACSKGLTACEGAREQVLASASVCGGMRAA